MSVVHSMQKGREKKIASLYQDLGTGRKEKGKEERVREKKVVTPAGFKPGPLTRAYSEKRTCNYYAKRRNLRYY